MSSLPHWLRQLQRLLLVNWFIIPALWIVIWYKTSFFTAIFFVALWFVADRGWDYLTGILIQAALRLHLTDANAGDYAASQTIPPLGIAMMLLDLAGTMAVPWLCAVWLLR